MPDASEELNEDIRQFLIESAENLAQLDIDIVLLERAPANKKLISSVFRTIHTIKGTCGFFGFQKLGGTAHVAENILGQVRDGRRELTPELITLILESVDKIKVLLYNIENDGKEGAEDCTELIDRLDVAFHEQASSTPPQPAPPVVPPPPPVLHISVPDAVVLPVQVAEATPLALPAERRGDSRASDSTIRVDVGLLDKLMNLVGELVVARNQLLQDSGSQSATLHKTSQRLNLITSELQAGVMKTRMQPIGVVWNKLPRIVRDLASQCGKQIRIEMSGTETELDKTIIEAIKDPLTHIVRNACDHGVEAPGVRQACNKDPEGVLQLRAYHEGGVVNIEITDDGAGIDPARMKAKALEKGLIGEEQAAQMSDQAARELVFSPGFSTAEEVTSISGRGVGMDVVQTNIQKIGGSVELLQGAVCGTVIRIRIPLTLAIIPGLIVSLKASRAKSPDERFVIPQANLLELVRLEGAKIGEHIKSLHGTPILHYRGALLPLIYLHRILGKPDPIEDSEVVSIVVLQAEGRQIGLVVDNIHDTQESSVKPLARQLKSLTCYLGATIMGDGLPALILDVAGLSRLALAGRNDRDVPQQRSADARKALAPTQKLLLFRAGSFERIAVPLTLVARLEKFASNRVQTAAGRAVMHYRDEILPLVSLANLLDPDYPQDAFAPETIQVIVFSDGFRQIGTVVDCILDIVEEPILARRKSFRPGLLGSAVIGGTITDLLDLHAVIAAAGEDWLAPAEPQTGGHRLLLVDGCQSARAILSDYLGASGYEVILATSAVEAIPKLRQMPFDLVIAAAEARSGEDLAMLKALRRERQFDHIPIVGLCDRHEHLAVQVSGGLRFDAQFLRSQRGDLLSSVLALLQSQQEPAEFLQAVA